MVARVSLIHTSLLPHVRIGTTPLEDGDCKPKALLNHSVYYIDMFEASILSLLMLARALTLDIRLHVYDRIDAHSNVNNGIKLYTPI